MGERAARPPASTAAATCVRLARVAMLVACVASSAGAEESVGPEAAEDVRILVENAVAVARLTLAKEGSFHPFAFFITADGRVQRVSPRADAALPSPDDVLALLQQTLREGAVAGEYRAIAVVADVVIALPGGGQSDALQVGVEHRDGYCANFFHPYERSSDGTIRFLEPISSERKGSVFPACTH